jgi:hypothetical protein
MIKLVIKANTIKQEKESVEWCKKRLKWYKQNRYVCVLPKDSVEKEYKVKDYQKIIQKIKSDWKKENLQRLIKILGKGADRTYKVYLTKYGVGGLYEPPDTIIVNISPEYNSRNKINVIIHEIIHLALNDFVKKNKLSHWQKENLIKIIEGIISNNLSVIDDYIFDLCSKLKHMN